MTTPLRSLPDRDLMASAAAGEPFIEETSPHPPLVGYSASLVLGRAGRGAEVVLHATFTSRPAMPADPRWRVTDAGPGIWVVTAAASCAANAADARAAAADLVRGTHALAAATVKRGVTRGLRDFFRQQGVRVRAGGPGDATLLLEGTHGARWEVMVEPAIGEGLVSRAQAVRRVAGLVAVPADLAADYEAALRAAGLALEPVQSLPGIQARWSPVVRGARLFRVRAAGLQAPVQ